MLLNICSQCKSAFKGFTIRNLKSALSNNEIILYTMQTMKYSNLNLLYICLRFFSFYKTLGGNTGGVFMIMEDSGQVFTKGFLDYETTPSYSLTIRVTDGGGKFSTAVASITLGNVDDNPPECSERHLQKSIAENTIVGSKVNAHAQDIQFTKTL